jgi:antitoxin CptB
MIKGTPIYKKAVFLAARRAMLENEMVTRDFVENGLPEHYTEEDMVLLCELLEKIYDNDLFDVVMGQKKASYFKGQYNIRFLGDIEKHAEKFRNDMKKRDFK